VIVDCHHHAGKGDGLTGPAAVLPQTPFTIARTFNVSSAAAPSGFTIAYYASTSSSTSQDFTQAILLGTETISAADDLTVGNHAGTSPAFQMNAVGGYYLFAVLNANNAFLESNSGNNVAVTAQATVFSGPVIVDYGQAGYSETGTWTSYSTGTAYGGSYRYATSAGNGNNTATWQVPGLTAGLYSVQVSWPAYSTNATNSSGLRRVNYAGFHLGYCWLRCPQVARSFRVSPPTLKHARYFH
jgi:hypothetical protein